MGWGLAVELYCGMGNPRVCSDKRIWDSGHGCGGAGGEPRRGAARRVHGLAYRLQYLTQKREEVETVLTVARIGRR